MTPVRIVLVCMVLLPACAAAGATPNSTTPSPSTTTSPATTSSSTTTTTTTTTTATTLAAAEPGVPARGRLVIHAVGDIDFSLPSTARAVAANGYEYPWTGMRGLFQRDHLTIVNLECVPSEMGFPIPKEWNLICPLEALGPMRQAGVDAANMANNHAGDMGKSALLDGRANLLDRGFLTVGAGADLAEANLPAVIEIEGWTIAVVGLSRISGDGPWFAREESPGVAPASIENTMVAVGAAAQVADIVIVTVHWGMGYALGPTGSDRALARAMIDAGANAVVGHHSHRLQALEVIDGVPVFWSMGNFIWPDLGSLSSRTGVAEIVVEPDGTVTGRIIPAYIEAHGRPELRGLPDSSLIPPRHAIE